MRKEHLRRKGWKENEIDHAAAILEKETMHLKHITKIVLWSALLLIVLGNIIVSLVLVPFLIVLNQYVLYGFIVILGAMIGFLYNFLIKDIGTLERKHHLSASVIIPILAVINMVVMVFVANGFISELNINNSPHNPWIVAIVFSVSFILPYIIGQFRKSTR